MAIPLSVQESVAVPRKQWNRGTGTADFAEARGFKLNIASVALTVKMADDAAGVVGYYIQGVQYLGAVVNVLNAAGNALSAAGDVTILY